LLVCLFRIRVIATYSFLYCLDLKINDKKMMPITEEAKRTVDEIVDDWLSNIDIFLLSAVLFVPKAAEK
jgi:DNA helicase TIP49 (TBP-interacting protein)